jgi:uncharacterized damage-inducible protein DinB
MKEGFKQQLQSAREFFDRTTRVLEEADSSFVPVPGMYTVAEQVAHTAQTIEWFIDGAFVPSGFDLDFARANREMRVHQTLSSARAYLAKAWQAACEAVDQHSEAEWSAPLAPGPVMGGAPRYAVIGALLDHTAHHRGSLAVYIRLLGKVPPMPYGDM